MFCCLGRAARLAARLKHNSLELEYTHNAALLPWDAYLKADASSDRGLFTILQRYKSQLRILSANIVTEPFVLISQTSLSF